MATKDIHDGPVNLVVKFLYLNRLASEESMMENTVLWSESDRRGSGLGTFRSCNPSLAWYPAAQPVGRGTVVVCPGGGYQMKADYEGEPVALWLNSCGINACVLDYRVSPDLYPAPQMDVRRAVAVTRTHAAAAGARTDRIGVLGFSAGGHLAASAGTMWNNDNERPDAMVLCYPVITMGKMGHAGSRDNLIGDVSRIDGAARIGDLSIENRVSRHTPPAFIWHTADDEAVPVENTLMLASALAANHVSFACHIFPHGRHGLGLAAEDPEIGQWTSLCAGFLLNLGF
jgi:acetyl esterase/lipase